MYIHRRYIINIFTISFLLLCVDGHGQRAFYFGGDASVNVNDSVVLRIQDYIGEELQWQNSYDKEEWTDIPGATEDTLLFVADTTKYFRAKVIAGKCDPFYSDVKKVDVYKLSADVLLINEEFLTLVSDSSDLASGIYRFIGHWDDAIEVGSVIVGQQNEGYMRHVLDIQQDPDEWILQTSQAGMEDVFDSFLLEDSVFITFDPGKTHIHGGRTIPLDILYLAPGASFRSDGRGIDFTGDIIYSGLITDGHGNTANIEVGVESGGVSFDPWIRRKFDYRKFVGLPTRLRSMHLSATGEIDANMTLYIEGDGAFNFSHKILIGKVAVLIPVGPVPLTASLSFYLGFDADMGAELYATAGFASEYQVAFGADYIRDADPQWSEIWERSADFSFLEPSFSFYGNLSAKGYIKPEIAMQITGVAGPYFSVDPYLRFEGELNYPEWQWELGAGVGGTLGFKVGLFGWDILDHNIDLFTWDNVLANGQHNLAFICGDNLTFGYRGEEVTYGTIYRGGLCWLDRNLGAQPMPFVPANDATGNTDTRLYGDLFQWGRLDDGHQDRESSTTSILSNGDVPGHGDFIIVDEEPWDWRSPQNDDLWQAIIGLNNPCPPGWRIPSESELDAERNSWDSGAYASPLKWALGGGRLADGSFSNMGVSGYAWSSSTHAPTGDFMARYLGYTNYGNGIIGQYFRAGGLSVRCVSEEFITPELFELGLVPSPAESGVVEGQGLYTEGEVIAVKATPNFGWLFTNWTGDIDYLDNPTSAIATVTMPAYDISLTASFEEMDYPVYGDGVVDIDGNEYVTVIIGGQEWMAENLRVTRYNNGEDIPTGLSNAEWGSATEGAYAIFNHNNWNAGGINSPAEMVEAYGKLYNWYTVDDPRGLCPEGWSVPSLSEWEQLSVYIDPDYGSGINSVGEKLKSCRQVNSPLGNNCNVAEHPRWDQHEDTFGIDSFGFSATPGGARTGSTYPSGSGLYVWLGRFGNFYASTNVEIDGQYRGQRVVIDYRNEAITTGATSKETGYPIRCIKD